MKKKIIGVIGPVASGKDLAAEYFAKKLNCPCVQISAPLLDILKEKNISPTRDETATLSSELTRLNGDEYLAKLALAKIDKLGIISGMRQLGQIEYLTTNADLFLVSIDASPEIRFERAKSRNKLKEAKNVEEFTAGEQRENSAPHALRLFECMKLADLGIENNGGEQELYEKLDEIIKIQPRF